jgi:hypothetical protein
MDKEKLIRRGNESIAIGALLGVGSLAYTCPLCIFTGGALVVNGIREKVL